jgi:hypothetical protein
MGPLLLVDKSFIQSLSEEEIEFLDKHYLVIITPILIQEICANLLKYPDDENLSKTKVSILAKKARGFSAKVVGRAKDICTSSLLGERIELKPCIPISGGREVSAADGTKGIVFEESIESKTLARWAQMEFRDQDLKLAADHIKGASYDLGTSGKAMADEFPRNAKYKTFEELVASIDRNLTEYPGQGETIESCMSVLGLPEPVRVLVRDRWTMMGKPHFRAFAEYAYYWYRLASVFWIGVTSGLIPTSKKAKALCDVQYLNYLPFAHAFCTNDRFQQELSQYFLREEQKFIWGEDLKKDLDIIASCYRHMTEEERKYYELHYGHYPPPIIGSITHILWQNFMRPWTPRSGNLVSEMSDETKKKLLEKIKGVTNAFDQQANKK